jgi:hypothetical protein
MLAFRLFSRKYLAILIIRVSPRFSLEAKRCEKVANLGEAK